MSLGTLLKSIWAAISSLWNNLESELKVAIHIGVDVTQAIKTFDDNNPEVADIITTLIPGDVDDKIKNSIRAALPNILIKLRLVDAAAQAGSPQDIVRSAIAVIKSLDPSINGNFLDGLSIAIAQVTADGKLTWNDAKYLLKWYYDNQYQNGTAVNSATTEPAPQA